MFQYVPINKDSINRTGGTIRKGDDLRDEVSLVCIMKSLNHYCNQNSYIEVSL
jgi:hypothetical protein